MLKLNAKPVLIIAVIERLLNVAVADIIKAKIQTMHRRHHLCKTNVTLNVTWNGR